MDELKMLVDYLRSAGITEYSDGKITLKLGPTIGPKPVTELPNVRPPVDPAIRRLTESLPREYAEAFGFEEVVRGE